MKASSCIKHASVPGSISTLLLSAMFFLFFLPQAHAATITVDSTLEGTDGDLSTGNLTLREAISTANIDDTIIFDGTAFPNATIGTITLSTGELLITKALTISGGGKVTIDANNTSRIFNIDDSIASLINVSITGMILKNGTSAANGGAIYNSENLAVSNSTFTNNISTLSGGAIYYHNGSPCTIDNTSFSNNTATVSENTNNAAVLPMSDSVLIRQLKLSQDVPTLWLGLGLSFQIGNEAWPWATLQFIQQRRVMLRHQSSSFNVYLITYLIILQRK